jgi:uncharacterized membrane protein
VEVLIRLLTLLITALFTVHAEDTILLNAHIRMIPKIMALDTQALSHNPSGKATLAIVYDNNRRNNAKKIADEINNNYNGNVGVLPFVAIPLSVDELVIRRDIAFTYLIDMSKISVNRVAAWGSINNIPTFSYNAQNLDLGILGTIVIERSTVIYINKNVLKAGKFRFNDTLFQIARLVE